MALISGLESLADVFPVFVVTSGYRCAKHNHDVGGVPDSQHVLGKASDIQCELTDPTGIALAAEKIPVFANGGIGLYSRFTHLDVRGVMARWDGDVSC